ncbi:hypothetical protein ID866_12616 [Astraeus odoratus]|nr:hypothetical protein ID866_12616 [Astraeus odoratus]
MQTPCSHLDWSDCMCEAWLLCAQYCC